MYCLYVGVDYTYIDVNALAQNIREREREMFYLTTHSTHFIYGYMASYIWLRTILIVRKETRRGLNPFWPHKFGFKPLLGLEPMAPIRPQLLVSHTNHSATETSIKCMYVCMCICMCICMGICMCIYVCVYVCMYV